MTGFKDKKPEKTTRSRSVRAGGERRTKKAKGTKSERDEEGKTIGGLYSEEEKEGPAKRSFLKSRKIYENRRKERKWAHLITDRKRKG